LAQSQVTFKKVLEKVPDKVCEALVQRNFAAVGDTTEAYLIFMKSC
jgi:hypothetical protein